MYSTRNLQIGTALILMLCPLLANACDVAFDDWKLKQGDIIAVKKPDVETIGTKNPAIELILSQSAATKLYEITKRYADNDYTSGRKLLPISIGSSKLSPHLPIPISDGRLILDLGARDKYEVDELFKYLRKCQ